MATVIPVDEFITDEWYPGFKPGYTHAPWYIDPVQTFRKEDEENFWFLDFHWPRGPVPPRRHAHLRLAAAGDRRARDRPAGQAAGARAAAVPAELRRDLGSHAGGGERELGLLPWCGHLR